ncbi:hypothetical protein ATANTOWER_017714 [Ataeniobius toweri]|uniref:Uncharacterized protein n=1 Tax=Ataeniobius toweri TaxID=208326 RepID=A0ABU7B7K4_9TELE|nr:hypothetical protein [Ataeniobius toweri]
MRLVIPSAGEDGLPALRCLNVLPSAVLTTDWNQAILNRRLAVWNCFPDFGLNLAANPWTLWSSCPHSNPVHPPGVCFSLDQPLWLQWCRRQPYHTTQTLTLFLAVSLALLCMAFCSRPVHLACSLHLNKIN